MARHEHDLRIDYIEFPAIDVAQSKAFYVRVFGWQFAASDPQNGSRCSPDFCEELELIWDFR